MAHLGKKGAFCFLRGLDGEVRLLQRLSERGKFVLVGRIDFGRRFRRASHEQCGEQNAEYKSAESHNECLCRHGEKMLG